jgi:uncharacterized phiE125 gp8 family phage protein
MYRPASEPIGDEPLTIADAAAHVRANVETEAAYLSACITAAREHAEFATGRALVRRDWELVLDAFPARVIEIDKVPVDVASITIHYTDEDGVQSELPAEQFVVVNGEPCRLEPVGCWPATARRIGAVVVRFEAGGDAPEIIKAALRLHVGDMYEHREETVVGQTPTPRGAIRAIYDSHRVSRWYA